MNDPYNLIEDLFVVDDEGWIKLPGDEGSVSPDGMVYDNDGKPMYSLYEDSEAPLTSYVEDYDDYEWMN